MLRKVIATDQAPKAIGPYAQAIRAQGLVFCSGQIALDPATGDLVGVDDVRIQTEQVLENLRAVLGAAGSGLEHAVKATIYLTDMGEFGAVNEVYARFFEGLESPARATVQVSALPRGARVEIDMVALAEPLAT